MHSLLLRADKLTVWITGNTVEDNVAEERMFRGMSRSRAGGGGDGGRGAWFC